MSLLHMLLWEVPSMGYLKIAMEVTMALFAVIGVYSAARMLAMRLFGSRRLILAVELCDESAMAEAEEAIRDALAQFLLVPSGRVCVLTLPAFCEDERLVLLARKYGVPVYVLAQERDKI